MAGIIEGRRAGDPRPISSIDDAGVERLAVDSVVSAVSEINTDAENDEMAVFGGVNGSETADAATRQIINVGAEGSVRTDTKFVGGNLTSVDGGRQQVNATLQVADTDVANGNPVPVSDAAGSLTVDNPALSVVGAGAEATAQRVTLATESLSALEAITVQNPAGASAVNVQDGGNVLSVDDAAGSLTVDNPTLSVVGAGAEATAQRVTLATESLSALESITVQNPAGASAVNVQDGGNSLTVDQVTAANLNAQVVGDVAHDGVDAGNPVKMGGKAVAHGANPVAVAAADRTNFYANRHGVQFVMGGHPNSITVEYNTTAAQTDDEILGITVAAGTIVVVTRIDVTLDEATTVGVGFRVGFGAASVPAEAVSGSSVSGIVASHPGLVPGGGMTKGDGGGIIGIGADGQELRITNEVPTSGKLRVVTTYYTIES
jgi:hypothetical protein